jgi:RHS repeat-associated protein
MRGDRSVRVRRLSSRTRALAAAMALVAAVSTRPVSGAPADIFTQSVAAPAAGGDPPKRTEIKSGDASVSTQTGNLTYSYPIDVPPGRQGAAPKLALTYSSTAPIYGGIAAGWTLSGLPGVYEDTSQGRFRTRHRKWFSENPDLAKEDDRFTSSLVGGRRLIKVNEPLGAGVWAVYRANHDHTYTRFERMQDGQPFKWRALTSDGMTYQFGGGGAACPGVVSEDHAPLTRTIDPFGNTVEYFWSLANGECRINTIWWGANTTSNLSHFAEVTFQYEPGVSCNLIYTGSHTDLRTGRKIVTGTARLQSIVARAFVPGSGQNLHTRTITLGYASTDQSCGGSAPVRLLTSITESASGVDAPPVALPPITFSYGATGVTLDDVHQQSGVPWAMGGSNFQTNLSGGKRYHVGDSWPTLEEALIDVNGDGLPDRLKAEVIGGNCAVKWRPNLGLNGTTLQFGPEQTFTLPRLKWQNNGSQPQGQEGCALNGQRTYYSNASGSGTESYLAYRWLDVDHDGLIDLVAGIYHDELFYDPDKQGEPQGPLGAWPPCTNLPEPCNELSSDCMERCLEGMDFHWGCVAGCDLAAERSCADHMAPPPQGMPAHMLKQAGTPSAGVPRVAYDRCDKRYPWFIYKNQGNGVFATTPVIKYNPAPIDPETAHGSIAATSFVNQDNAVMDVDGDGVPDYVVRYKTPQPSSLPFYWRVWLGDGTGGFEPESYLMRTRPYASLNTSVFANNEVRNKGGLIDINGDGLPDQWEVKPNNETIDVALHDGTKYRLPGFVGEISPPGGIRLGWTSWAIVVSGSPQNALTGTWWSRDRMLDVDGDGRIDVLNYDGPAPGNPGMPRVYMNHGGNFMWDTVFPNTTAPYLDMQDVRTEVTALCNMQTSCGVAENLTWHLHKDLMDLDGDGVIELVRYQGGQLKRAVSNFGTSPPRLLTSIQNGRGTTTTVEYASMHSDAVKQNPDVVVAGRPRASPRPQWVVKKLTTTDTLSDTSGSTSYFYENPRFGADDEGKYAFRGFEEVTTTAQSGAKTRQHYAYSPDWSGRLVKTVVIPQEAPGEVRSIETTTWQSYTLFGGAITTFHPIEVDSYTCKNGQTEATCTIANGAGFTRAKTTWTTLATSGNPSVPVMRVATQTYVQAHANAGEANGDRRTETTYFLFGPDAATYRLSKVEEVRRHRENSAWQVYAQRSWHWDPTVRVIEYDSVYASGTTVDVSVTRFEYDLGTGNLIFRWSPNHEAGSPSTPKTTFEYDDRELFVSSEINPLGHRVLHTYDYGTGTRLSTRGPNHSGCMPNCAAGQIEQSRIRIDGLGRTIETFQTFSDNGTTFVERKVGITSYVDSQSETSVTNQFALDLSGSVITYGATKTELDGLGRPIREISYVFGSAPADAISTYVYRDDGTLAEARVPDPTQNNASTVTYTYTFDSLGRATGIRRPDSANPALQSGVNISYDGLTQTRVEVLGSGPGLPAQTRTTTDAFGRLVKVEEQRAAGPLWATTNYEYSPHDSVKKITDPDNIVTELDHDRAGRRTQIKRGTRIWQYGYDRNGNVISEIVPCTGTNCEATHTTSIAYDAIDRPIEKLIAPRALSAADLNLFGAVREAFAYDTGANGIGQLATWETFGPTGADRRVRTSATYNAQGQPLTSTQEFTAADYNLTRSLGRTYFISGAPRQTSYNDSIGGANATTSTLSYDPRGLPASVSITAQPRGAEVTSLTRNVAGLVTLRSANVSGGANTSTWIYDKLGRVENHEIKVGTTQIARQLLAYQGNDDPQTLDHWLGPTNRKQLTFGYDYQHQLTSVGETQLPNAFTATYNYRTSGSGRLAGVTEAAAALAGSDVMPRNVTYVYASNDEQVTALKKVGGGNKNLATYTYDPIGNQLSRDYVDSKERWDYVYDGKNQLRRATKKLNGAVQGSEEYWYDGGNQRVAVLRKNQSGQKLELITFTGEVQAHYTGAGAITHVFSYVSMGSSVARIKRTNNTATVFEYVFHGLASNTLATVDRDNGATTANFLYAPFGELVESSGGSDYRRRLNDKYVDEISNLGYYGYRYYDRVAMQWTQADPLYRIAPDAAMASSPRRANLYQFSLGNPLRYMDPDGLDPQWSRAPVVDPQQTCPLCDGGPANRDGKWIQEGNKREALREARQAWGEANLACGGCLGIDAWFESVKAAGPKSVLELVEMMGGTLASKGARNTRRNGRNSRKRGGSPHPEGIAPSGPAQGGSGATGGTGAQTAVSMPGFRSVRPKLPTPDPFGGGVYVLIEPTSRTIMYVGRTNNFSRREMEHAREGKSKGLEFSIAFRTDSLPAQRGLEQMIIEQHRPSLNLINSISPTNPRRQMYMNAAKAIVGGGR